MNSYTTILFPNLFTTILFVAENEEKGDNNGSCLSEKKLGDV